MPSLNRAACCLAVLPYVLVQAACSESSTSDSPVVPTSAEDAGVGTEDSGVPSFSRGVEVKPCTPGPETRPLPETGTFCGDLGLRTRPFQPESGGLEFGEVAGDFTVQTLDGPWRLADNWRGCDSYLFATYIPLGGEGAGIINDFWGSSVQPLIESPINAHYFFLSLEPEEDARRSRVGGIQDRILRSLSLGGLSDEERALQEARFHFVVDEPDQVEGSFGTWFGDYLAYALDPSSRVEIGADRAAQLPPLPFAVGIDREQKWDSVGSLSEFVGGPWSLRMVSFLPSFYDHKVRLQDELEFAQCIHETPLVTGTVTDRVFNVPVELPRLEDMAQFDTLDFEVEVHCGARNVFACSEWDRIARVSMCADEACMSRQELIRWITPYWRRGTRQWLIDASALLPLLDAGEDRRRFFRVEMGPGWERATPRDVKIVMRLSNRAKPLRAMGAEPLFGGGTFNESYNDDRPTVERTVPATAEKAEIVYILSGHGQETDRCAEWCNHEHLFTVQAESMPLISHTGQIGSLGCGPAAGLGVPPGQYGNWAPERAYWCPGLPVELKAIDVSEAIDFGMPNFIRYAGLYQGGEPTTGGNISLSSYLVWYEPPND